MELLQSQAPIDWELSESSASAKRGTFDIRHQTLDMGNRNLKILEAGAKFGPYLYHVHY